MVKRIYAVTTKFPKSETFGLADQMQRAAVPVMANIAERFERGSNTEFTQFLFVTRASCDKVRAHLYVALDLNYATQSETDDLRERYER